MSGNKEINNKEAFLNDLEEVSVIIKVNGKRYLLVPKEVSEDNKKLYKETCKEIRILALDVLLDTHAILQPSLEEIQKKQS